VLLATVALALLLLTTCIVLAVVFQVQEVLIDHFDNHKSDLKRSVDEYWWGWMFDYLVVHLLVISLFGAYTVGTVLQYHSNLVWQTWRTGRSTTTLSMFGHETADEVIHHKVMSVLAKHMSWGHLKTDKDLLSRAIRHMKLDMHLVGHMEKRESANESRLQNPMWHATLQMTGTEDPEMRSLRDYLAAKRGGSLDDSETEMVVLSPATFQCSRKNKTMAGLATKDSMGEYPMDT